VHIATRSDGTTIHRVEGRHTYYVKAAPARDPDDLRFHPPGEAARLAWLGARGFPVPEVVEAAANADTMWLVTTAIEGRSAAGRWSPADRRGVLDVVADLTRALHALPARDCPFDRTLAVLLPRVRAAARAGWVDCDDLDDTHAGWTAQQLLGELDAAQPPDEDRVVVCHGDLCLDNVLIAPDTLSLAGILDVGRLGTADRWLDLSIVLRNITGECPDWECPGLDSPGLDGTDADSTAWDTHQRRAGRFLRRYGLAETDERKLAYYRLLDEFT
jgi:kanamycin kinase